MTTITDARRQQLRDAGRKGGRTRALAFTSESQRQARAAVRPASLSASGRKGYLATVAKHGYDLAYRAARRWRLDNPSKPERAAIALLHRLGFSDYEREYEPYPGECLSLDFAWPAERHAIEVNGNVHHLDFCDPDGHRAERESNRLTRLRADGWQILILDTRHQDAWDAQLRAFLRAFEIPF